MIYQTRNENRVPRPSRLRWRPTCARSTKRLCCPPKTKKSLGDRQLARETAVPATAWSAPTCVWSSTSLAGTPGKGLGLQDLIEEGNLGLLRAVEGFDPAVGTRFSTYASYWIKQSIKRALINTAKTIRIPAYMVELLSKWRRASARLTEELGRHADARRSRPRPGPADERSCRSSRRRSASTTARPRPISPTPVGRWARW